MLENKVIITVFITLVPFLTFGITPQQRAFFEQNIRPTLEKHCYECHAETSKKLKGSFLIDSKAGWERGGDTGQVLIPGHAEDSIFMKMVRHDPDYSAMPPKSKLSNREIDNLTKWINEGAYDPREQPIGELKNVDHFNLEERKQWWAFQEISSPPIPVTSNPNWAHSDYDHFIHSRLDQEKWTPSPPANREELLRRVSFDLIGLAPTLKEREAFLKDSSPRAYERVVDRLIASPHFGEKWARHWMDAVRFGESKSFEFDYVMQHAYQYRDYLIKVFNEDVPYNDFIRESLAGDLIESPRISKEDKISVNESLKGPGFIYLTDGQHGPADLHEDEARIFSGIIDTTTKAFLGITVQCAQCHDHKFDAVTTGDYYSLYGMLKSSRHHIANSVSTKAQLPHEEALKTLKPLIIQAGLDDSLHDINNIELYLKKAQELSKSEIFRKILPQWLDEGGKSITPETDKKQLKALLKHESAKSLLDSHTLEAWLRLLHSPTLKNKHPELANLYRLPSKREPYTPTALSPPHYETDLKKWYPTGLAFKKLTPKAHTGVVLQPQNQEHVINNFVNLRNPLAGHHSGKITGALRSPDFTLDGNPVELYAKGHNATINLIIRNYEQVGKGPTTRLLSVPINDGHWRKVSIPSKLWQGHPAYIELIHNGQDKALTIPLKKKAEMSFLTVSTSLDHPLHSFKWSEAPIQKQIQGLYHKIKNATSSAQETEVISSLFNAGLIRASETRSMALKHLMNRYRATEALIPPPIYTRSLTEGTPQDEAIYIRGNHKSLSKELNRRRNMDALGGAIFTENESGRRDLAEALTSLQHPLVSRVYVNRLWHHIFGQGIVPTLNDFGKLGTYPSHPELLDYLAKDLMNNGWSTKYLLKKMVTSSTYQMGSKPSAESQHLDPNNRLLQHMPMKRLEAEMIRDHILNCSGRLDKRMFGPSIIGYTADIPPSRGIPPSGSLDSDGRRSLYIQLRRNSLPTFLRAFGLPNATEPIGARDVTNVPAQSLAMMNSEFVKQQAEHWAHKVITELKSDEDRIKRIHEVAFSREATEAEITWSHDFLSQLRHLHSKSKSEDPSLIFTDFCHTIFNRKEFLYLK